LRPKKRRSGQDLEKEKTDLYEEVSLIRTSFDRTTVNYAWSKETIADIIFFYASLASPRPSPKKRRKTWKLPPFPCRNGSVSVLMSSLLSVFRARQRQQKGRKRNKSRKIVCGPLGRLAGRPVGACKTTVAK
jgi:hypothetical protein